MNHRLTLLFFIFSLQLAMCQESFTLDYPEGLYVTKQDFIDKKPSIKAAVFPTNIDKHREEITTTTNHCFFRYRSTEKKVKRTFAIVYKGSLYFQNTQIVLPKNRNKKDRDQTMYKPNAFARVQIGGKNFLYFETELHSAWEAGLYANLGAAGGVVAASMGTLKSVVWDFKRKEFNIFRNCKDLNLFLQAHYPDEVTSCKKKKYDINKGWEAIDKIK